MRVLHVDDDHDIRQLALLGLVEFGGFDVLQCESGQEALEKAAEFAPDIVLIDMMMPGLNGQETLIRLRQIDGLETIPAIFMSAKGPSDLKEIAGEEAVISKPFDPLTIAQEVRDIWEQRRG